MELVKDFMVGEEDTPEYMVKEDLPNARTYRAVDVPLQFECWGERLEIEQLNGIK